MINGILQTNLSYDNYEYQEFMEAAKDYDIILHDSRYIDTFNKYDFTLNRSYLEVCISKQQGKQFNRLCDGYFWSNKNRQQHLDTYVNKVKTIYGTNLTFNYCRELLQCPFIAKRSLSFGGNGTFLIRSQEDFDKATHCDIYQEMVWSSFGKDLRVMCIGGEIIGVMKRENTSGNFRANAHVGGEGSVYQIDSDIKETVRSIYNQTQLDIMGIDLLFDKNGYYFCELNVNPGFKEFDKCFNLHTSYIIIDHILNSLDNT